MNSFEKKTTMGYLVIIALLDFMGLGVVVTIFPHLLLDNQSQILPLSWSYNERLTALGMFLAIYPLGQFFGAVILGKLSDHHGRKKMLIISLLGTLIGFCFSAISIAVSSALLLFVSRLVSGLFAGNVAIAQASMADISDEKTKTKNLTLIQIALGLAWVFGPPLGGWLSVISLGNLPSAATPFLFMVLALGLTLAYSVTLFNETLVQTKKLGNIFTGFSEIAFAYSNQKYRYALIIWFVFVSGWWLFEAFLPSYLMQVFNFSSGQIGNFLATMGATYALFQYLVVQQLANKMKPENMVKGALIIASLAVFAVGLVETTFQLHVAITIFVTSMGFVLPGLIGAISNLANKEDQGHIMGMISSVQAIATVLMMMIGGYLDNSGITVTIMGGAGLLLISWALFTIGFKEKPSSVKVKQIVNS